MAGNLGAAEVQWESRTGGLRGGICRGVTAASDVERVAVQRASGAEIRTMPAQRLQGCRSLHLNEDNGRFVLLALLIVVYLLCGAAVFSAIERPSEVRAHGRWNGTLLNFSETFNISLQELNSFLREYEAAIAAGIRADALRPRWDFTGAFYFVGTVVSTIGGWFTWPLHTRCLKSMHPYKQNLSSITRLPINKRMMWLLHQSYCVMF